MTLRVLGIDSSLRDLELDTAEEVNKELRVRTFAAQGDAQSATPVDTGRARNSWRTRDLGPDTDGFDTFEVRNIVNYIENLNMGSSRQAGANFIEESFLRYFDEASVEVYDDPEGN